MAIRATHRKFTTTGDRTWVVEAMTSLAACGTGWINVQPSLSAEGDEGDDEPEPPPKAPSWFASRAPTVPLATWTAPGAGRKGTATVARIGIQHGGGMRAIPWLREGGIERPAGSRVLTDSPIRGLVLELSADPTDHAEVLDWMLLATARLCVVVVADRWQATVFS